ncbi:myotubularin-related protein 6 isoform X3 [Ornithorhynchus anatinus]|uniref:myotubularin-related protein 6 isoform X3 n=1 Tax=Ornithorhynchus anatinus TaxID=9258 RepID=UPI0010A92931|nr:myotubularin-related protein 6 isoform X3 [Ornithorhynchus anatinus]
MEHIRTTKVEQVRLLDRFSSSSKSLTGTLYLTATHLLFIDSLQKETWILHHHIAAVEKLALTTSGCPLVIQCKNFRVVHFVVPRERDCHDIYNSLLQLSRRAAYDELYAFSYNPKQNECERVQGWQLVALAAEYQRMGVPNSNWQLSDTNRDYKICETYPRELYVPRIASIPVIVGSSKFRSKGRFPVLSYFHSEKEAAICRCSQPLSGFSARCLEDEHMLQAISKANPVNRYVYVMDTRPKRPEQSWKAAQKNIGRILVRISSKIWTDEKMRESDERARASCSEPSNVPRQFYGKLNAIANRAAGKGYENEDNYSNIRFQFVGIENIHVMRSSLQKLLEVSGTRALSVNDFFSGLESSGWLRHIKAVLDAAIFLAKAINVENASVLVHCSDGWDRTAQVCSLGSLLLDSYYRTVRGFMIHEHVHSCQFGNFLGNHQKEREDLKLREKTYSLWPFLLEDLKKYLNPLYRPEPRRFVALEPSTVPFHLKFWRSMYHQFDRTMHPRQCVYNLIMKKKEQNQQLEKEIRELEAKIKQTKTRRSDEAPTKECLPPGQTPAQPGPRAPPCFRKEQRLGPATGGDKTIDRSDPPDNRYRDLAEEFSKADPAIVGLECGVARMAC